MLTKKQVEEIKEHLDKAQNPIFFFDNDQDGLCSFLLLQRYLGRGKGVPIKSFPDLTKNYFRKVHELKADYIFILDKAVISPKFFEEAEKYNIPTVWIDHHIREAKDGKIPDFVYYYNPLFGGTKSKGGTFIRKADSGEPVTYLCHQITKEKKDLWIGVVGCISDRFVPDFYGEFRKQYPELSVDFKNVNDIFYKSQIGKVAQILGNGLKDRTTNVINMLRFLRKSKSPYDVLEETSKNRTMHERFKQINSRSEKFIEKAKETVGDSKLLFFKFGGDLSVSGDVANYLIYLYPEKVVVVAYVTEAKANISVRGRGVRKIVLKAIENIEDSTGGGHEDAVGVGVKIKDLEKFRKNMEKLIK